MGLFMTPIHQPRLTWFGPLLLGSVLALVGHICPEVARVLAALLAGVEHQPVRAQRPPGLPPLARPVLVALLLVLEDVGVRGELGEGRAPGKEGRYIF